MHCPCLEPVAGAPPLLIGNVFFGIPREQPVPMVGLSPPACGIADGVRIESAQILTFTIHTTDRLFFSRPFRDPDRKLLLARLTFVFPLQFGTSVSVFTMFRSVGQITLHTVEHTLRIPQMQASTERPSAPFCGLSETMAIGLKLHFCVALFGILFQYIKHVF